MQIPRVTKFFKRSGSRFQISIAQLLIVVGLAGLSFFEVTKHLARNSLAPGLLSTSASTLDLFCLMCIFAVCQQKSPCRQLDINAIDIVCMVRSSFVLAWIAWQFFLRHELWRHRVEAVANFAHYKAHIDIAFMFGLGSCLAMISLRFSGWSIRPTSGRHYLIYFATALWIGIWFAWPALLWLNTKFYEWYS